MRDINFFSSNNYLFLPTKKNPKVAIAVDDFDLAKNSFNLYNPFSLKAKFLKIISKSLYLYLNPIGKLFTIQKEKSEFIKYLEKKLNQSLVVSVYFATIQDKAVLQLQSRDAEVLGYLKYPLNETGLKHIKNEIKAFELLSSLKIVEPYLLSGHYNNQPFLFLKELNGDIGIVNKRNIETILDRFRRESSYRLAHHPRILEMTKSIYKNRIKEYRYRIEKIIEKSTIEYQLVYEHGDFTPWNIIKVEKRYIPFDFEYFVEDGLEYFDTIKYYYQIGKLLKQKSGEALISYIYKEVDIPEIKELLELFLIKEIIRGKEENQPFEFEEKIIKILEK